MATGGSGESLPDLDFLSEEERRKIELVLRADDELNKRDEERLRYWLLHAHSVAFDLHFTLLQSLED